MRSVDTFLKKHALKAPYNDTLLLLSHVLQKPKEFLLAHGEYPLSIIQYLRISVLIHWYTTGWPLAYLTGHKEFYGLDFLVNKHTLVPRPDTELMVEEVIERIRNQESGIRNTILIDVGTGTGCIPLAINRAIQQYNNITIKTFATDISRRALRVAKKNAARYHVPINFLHGSLLEPFIKNYSLLLTPYSFLIITANLPYLTPAQFASEPSIQHEPRSALIATNGGLALYEQLLIQITSLLLLTPYSLLLFLEIDPSQSTAITSLIKQHLPTATLEIKTDLALRDRLVVIRVNSQASTT